MKSKANSNQSINAGSRRGRPYEVFRESVVQSALTGRARKNHTIHHCPYQSGTDAAALWLKVFKTGKEPKEKEAPAEKVEKIGTDVAIDKPNE